MFFMCDINGPFRLCSCSDKIDRIKTQEERLDRLERLVAAMD